MAPSIKDTPAEVVHPVSRQAVLAAYPEMMMAIPVAEDNDGSGIIADILMASTWEDLNTDSKLPAGKDLVGRTLRVFTLTRHESDLGNGLGWFLVADAVDSATGEMVKFQTSAGALMAKLVKLHSLGALPAVIEITSAQTNSGMTAVDCQVRSVG